MKLNQKKNILHIFRETKLVSAYIRNRKLKVKLWWVETRKRKKNAFFVLFILSEGMFFLTYVISLNVWRIKNTFRIYIWNYIIMKLHIKNHFFIHFLPVFKIIKNLQCILKFFSFNNSLIWRVHFLLLPSLLKKAIQHHLSIFGSRCPNIKHHFKNCKYFIIESILTDIWIGCTINVSTVI